MGLGSYGVVTAASTANLGLFLASFWVLFTAAGAGNGSTYRMIPAIFAATSRDLTTAKRESAATLGIAGAVGALGGFYLPRAIGDSYHATGGIGTAFTWFAVGYAACLALTWWCYLRRRVLVSRVPSLAHATVLPRRALTLRIGEHALTVRGHAALVDGELRPLAPAPMAVLRALAARPGRVMSRAALLRALPQGADEHAVEMAVARLRAGIGAPHVVQTVIKRGYRLPVD